MLYNFLQKGGIIINITAEEANEKSFIALKEIIQQAIDNGQTSISTFNQLNESTISKLKTQGYTVTLVPQDPNIGMPNYYLIAW